jgi:hypothetical protein
MSPAQDPDERRRHFFLNLTLVPLAVLIAALFAAEALGWHLRLVLGYPIALLFVALLAQPVMWGTVGTRVTPFEWWRETVRGTREDLVAHWDVGGASRARLVLDAPLAIGNVALLFVGAAVFTFTLRVRRIRHRNT